jgi:hypothetical protein
MNDRRSPKLSALHHAQCWEKRAKEARAQAEQMSAPQDRRQLLEIAASYERLAKLAEEGGKA